MKLLSISLILVSQICLTIAELYAAISHMESLLDTYKGVIDELDSYIVEEEKRIDHIKKTVAEYKKEYDIARVDAPNYLGDPMRAFSLINKLTTDLNLMEKRANSSVDSVKKVAGIPDLTYPSADDLNGAALAVVRVTDTYNLNVTELANERHNGESAPMSSGECYALGRTLYHQNQYNQSLDWMHEALKKYGEHGDYYITKIDIMEYIAYTYHVLNEHELALEWTRRILELDPNHPRALLNIANFESTVTANKRTVKLDITYTTYEKLCRGELALPENLSKNLYCRYQNSRHPFLRLAPIKEEQVYRRPDIFVFHQVLSEREIKEIQDMARPRFKRATVIDLSNQENKTSLVSTHRTGKTAFLADSDGATLVTLTRRVGQMTGLDTSSSEDLQIVDYGVGGHYGPHDDCATGPGSGKAFGSNGNRVATVLFYLTEVVAGGSTVFPELGLAVPPRRGSAVFWVNLHPSGECDLGHKHASCPVVKGTKWVSTKWLHLAGQEFIRPCGLEYQKEGILWKIAKPVPTTSRLTFASIFKDT